SRTIRRQVVTARVVCAGNDISEAARKNSHIRTKLGEPKKFPTIGSKVRWFLRQRPEIIPNFVASLLRGVSVTR
ncbi:MAG: hypothetical protein WCD78_24835, partial [Pseudolabrys sp.]